MWKKIWKKKCFTLICSLISFSLFSWLISVCLFFSISEIFGYKKIILNAIFTTIRFRTGKLIFLIFFISLRSFSSLFIYYIFNWALLSWDLWDLPFMIALSAIIPKGFLRSREVSLLSWFILSQNWCHLNKCLHLYS